MLGQFLKFKNVLKLLLLLIMVQLVVVTIATTFSNYVVIDEYADSETHLRVFNNIENNNHYEPARKNNGYDINEEGSLEHVEYLGDGLVQINGNIILLDDSLDTTNSGTNYWLRTHHLLSGGAAANEIPLGSATIEFYIDGTWRPGFCIEYGIPLPTHANNISGVTNYFETYVNRPTLTEDQENAIRMIMMYGFENFPGESFAGANDINAYKVTQALIWEITTGRDESIGGISNDGPAWNVHSPWPHATGGMFYDQLVAGDDTRVAMYNSIRRNIARHGEIPSFMSEEFGIGVAHELTWHEERNRYEIVLTDENYILPLFLRTTNIYTYEGYFFQRGDAIDQLAATNQYELVIWRDDTPFSCYDVTEFSEGVFRNVGTGNGLRTRFLASRLHESRYQPAGVGDAGVPLSAFLLVRVECLLEPEEPVFSTIDEPMIAIVQEPIIVTEACVVERIPLMTRLMTAENDDCEPVESVRPGQTVEYQLTVTNPKEVSLINLLVRDNLANGDLVNINEVRAFPVETMFDYRITEDPDLGFELWAVVDIPANSSVKIVFEADIAEGVDTTITNSGFLYLSSTEHVDDPFSLSGRVPVYQNLNNVEVDLELTAMTEPVATNPTWPSDVTDPLALGVPIGDEIEDSYEEGNSSATELDESESPPATTTQPATPQPETAESTWPSPANVTEPLETTAPPSTDLSFLDPPTAPETIPPESLSSPEELLDLPEAANLEELESDVDPSMELVPPEAPPSESTEPTLTTDTPVVSTDTTDSTTPTDAIDSLDSTASTNPMSATKSIETRPKLSENQVSYYGDSLDQPERPGAGVPTPPLSVLPQTGLLIGLAGLSFAGGAALVATGMTLASKKKDGGKK